jgi:Rps23 Pro-64 3,4-dihydroxylase Tpa1-like proline 4-hydroxylase
MSDAAAAISVADVGPELNPALDIARLAAEFRAKGRLHIPAILTPESSRRLYQALAQETPWRLTLNKGGDFLDFPNLAQDERNRIATGAWERARTQFQYLFDNHRLSHDGEAYIDPRHYYARFVAFLNAPHFLSVIREITGIGEIVRTDGQATLYRPGDFLTLHDDRYGGRHRLAAYVFNMTPGWKPDWGGVLNFYDARGHVEEGYVPSFNALNIFRVPAWHSVSQVAIFGGYRYSVTGWFHAQK